MTPREKAICYGFQALLWVTFIACWFVPKGYGVTCDPEIPQYGWYILGSTQLLWVIFILYKFRNSTANSKENKTLIKEQEKLLKDTRKETGNKNHHVKLDEDKLVVA
jgi:hypothetical protein